MSEANLGLHEGSVMKAGSPTKSRVCLYCGVYSAVSNHANLPTYCLVVFSQTASGKGNCPPPAVNLSER